MYTVSNGVLKPLKHLCLGVALKSLTGSRKVIEIVNHLGHSTGYTTTEEIETDLAISIQNQEHLTPDGMQRLPGLATGTAWDNYDENTETLSGADTLHDTVGICYQNAIDMPSIPSDSVPQDIMEVEGEEACQSQTTTSSRRKKRKSRAFDPKTTVIEPYRKKEHENH